MVRISIVSLFIFCCTLTAGAQNLKTIYATRRDWSGGVAGHHGSYLSFTVEFSNYKEEPIPDTIWIDSKPIPLATTIRNEKVQIKGNMNRTTSKKGVRFEINTGTSYDDNTRSIYPDPSDSHKELTCHQPVACKGVALLSYRYMGREHYYPIAKFTTVFPPVNYP